MLTPGWFSGGICSSLNSFFGLSMLLLGEFLIKDSVLSMPGPHCQALFFASGVMRVLGYDVQTRTPVKYFKIPNRTIRIETLGVNYWCGWTAFPAKLDNS